MAILLKNARVFTMNENCDILDNVCVLINDNKIEFVGDFNDLPNYDFECDIINVNGKLVMPGFVNAHSHVPMNIFRNYADDLDLNTWLFKYIFPREDKLDSNQVYWATLFANIEMIMTGTTCFCDMYFFSEDIVKAVIESGMRANISYNCTYDGNKDEIKNSKPYKRSIDLFEKWNDAVNGRIKVSMCAHSIYTCNAYFIECLGELVKKYGTLLQIHLSETKKEVDDCLEKYNMTPTEYCEKLGIFDVPTLLAHCVHMTDSDLDILAKYDGVSVVHNPSSNLKLASGIARIPDMLSRKINVCLGTDSASSNNKLDMFEEIRLSSLIHKGVSYNPKAVSALDSLKMAITNGAKASGFENLGVISEGMKADLIIVDTDRVNYLPDYNIVSALGYSSNGLDVETVIIDGKIVMKDRDIKTIDVENVKAEIKRIASN